MPSPFDFLEGILTNDTLSSLRMQEAENQRLAAQSMPASERGGFAAGNLIFGALSQTVGKGKQDRQTAQRNSAVLDSVNQEISQQQFTGPQAGLEKDVAMLQSMAQKFAAAGDQRAAMQAMIGANQRRTELEQEKQAWETRNLNNEGMQANIQLSGIRQMHERLNLDIDTPGYVVERGEDDQLTLRGMIENRTGPQAAAITERGGMVVGYDDAVDMFGEEARSARSGVLRGTDFAKERERLQAAFKLYDTGRQFAQVVMNAPIDPSNDVGGGVRLINRIQEGVGTAQATWSLIREDQQRGSEAQGRSPQEGGNYQDALRMSEDAIGRLAQDKAISASQVAEMAYTLALIFNGVRPTDRDFENAVLMLGGGSDGRRTVLNTMRETLERQGGQNITLAGDFIAMDPFNPDMRAHERTHYARAVSAREEYNALMNEAIGESAIARHGEAIPSGNIGPEVPNIWGDY